MGSNGKRYTQDFKEGVIRMIRENGRSVASISLDLGIAEQTIYRWLDKDKTLMYSRFVGHTRVRYNILVEVDTIGKQWKAV